MFKRLNNYYLNYIILYLFKRYKIIIILYYNTRITRLIRQNTKILDDISPAIPAIGSVRFPLSTHPTPKRTVDSCEVDL